MTPFGRKGVLCVVTGLLLLYAMGCSTTPVAVFVPWKRTSARNYTSIRKLGGLDHASTAELRLDVSQLAASGYASRFTAFVKARYCSLAPRWTLFTWVVLGRTYTFPQKDPFAAPRCLSPI